MDDFVSLLQPYSYKELIYVSRAILEGIHKIFPPPELTNHTGGNPISEKKLLAGDSLWATKKEILGWIFDGLERTMTLPEDKFEKIKTALKNLIQAKAVPVKKFQRTIGKLRHAALAIPGSKGLFSPINEALFRDPQMVPIQTNQDLLLALRDYRILLKEVRVRPTSVYEIYPRDPGWIGYVDAAGVGCGGVWLSATERIPPTVCQVKFPESIKEKLVTENNLNGTILNSDLELAGVLIHWIVLAYLVNTKHKKAGIWCDNKPSVY